jgi:predicted dehydrogenase
VSKVAIVGCGVIAPVYAKTLADLGFVELVACVDGVAERAQQLATAFGAEVRTLDEVVADPTIDAVVNLTPPTAHAAVTRSVLAAGKAAFSEKPLGIDLAEGRALVDLARERGLRLGCAPDTFLGAGLQSARASIDRGDIGEPLAANGFMLGSGPERWHPDPELFYAVGAGPLFDMGPYYLTTLVQLLGPARAISASARRAHDQRTIEAGDRKGTMFDVSVQTHVSSLIEFESGAHATLVTSFDVAASRYRHLEIYGTEATLAVPDPNTFGGPLRIRGRRDREWRELDLVEPNIPQERGIGLADMLWAQRTGRPHRASGELALHVLELMDAALRAADQGRRLELTTRCQPAAPLPVGLPPNTFDD